MIKVLSITVTKLLTFSDRTSKISSDTANKRETRNPRLTRQLHTSPTYTLSISPKEFTEMSAKHKSTTSNML